jgi:hypothetical protein
MNGLDSGRITLLMFFCFITADLALQLVFLKPSSALNKPVNISAADKVTWKALVPGPSLNGPGRYPKVIGNVFFTNISLSRMSEDILWHELDH